MGPRTGGEVTPVGWLHKIIVNKHVTGPPLDGQIQILGVWGTPSSHLHFTEEEPTSPWIYWKAPVFTLTPSDVPPASPISDTEAALSEAERL